MIINQVKKVIFSILKPKVIIVVGKGKDTAGEAIFQVLKQYLKIKKISDISLTAGEEILLLENDFGRENYQFLIEKSSLPILICTNIGDIPFDKNFFAGEAKEINRIMKLAKNMPTFGYLILNFDDETVRAIKTASRAHVLTFGLQEEADFKVVDVKLNGGTNFKIHQNGSIVPVWLEGVFGKEQVYAALSSAAVGKIFGLNLVEISQALKNYKSLPGKMKLIAGIKNSKILDDSQSATVFSMIEAIEILGKIRDFKRKIAVLGDVVGVGKYTIEAHETIGEFVAQSAGLLFAFGARARFIAEGAKQKGMPVEKIFQFDTIDDGKLKLQDEIREGDLILVDGSKEMEMKKIVEEIAAFV